MTNLRGSALDRQEEVIVTKVIPEDQILPTIAPEVYTDLGVVVPMGECRTYKQGFAKLSLCAQTTKEGELGMAEFGGVVNNTGDVHVCEIDLQVRNASITIYIYITL